MRDGRWFGEAPQPTARVRFRIGAARRGVGKAAAARYVLLWGCAAAAARPQQERSSFDSPAEVA